MKTYTIDFRNVRHFSEVHATIAEGLEFDDHYGCSLDALWDSLFEIYLGDGPILIEMIGLEAVEQIFDGYAEKLLDIFKRFKHFAKIACVKRQAVLKYQCHIRHF